MRRLWKNFTLVVRAFVLPSAAGDKKRFVTPREAVALGADYLVVGRPITEAADPIEAARRVTAEIANPVLTVP